MVIALSNQLLVININKLKMKHKKIERNWKNKIDKLLKKQIHFRKYNLPNNFKIKPVPAYSKTKTNMYQSTLSNNMEIVKKDKTKIPQNLMHHETIIFDKKQSDLELEFDEESDETIKSKNTR